MTHVSSKVRETAVPGIDRISELALAALTLFRALPSLTAQWRQRASDRRHLSELNDHVLADFGLTRQEVIDEAEKPFWRPLDPGSGR
jgi:uncharacterized protein YjiS (DUF1127 family)